MEDVFDEIHGKVIAAMSDQPNTPETRSALISVLIMLAAGLAKGEPVELRQHWAKVLYKHADALAESEQAPRQ